MNEHEYDRRFDETAVREILKCAIELDELKASSLSVIQLQSVASEIGISKEALAVAVAQVEQVRPLSGDTRRAAASVAMRWFAVGGAVVGATGLLYAIGNQTPFGPVLIALLVTAAGRAVLAPRRSGHRSFQAGNAGLWLGLAAAQAAVVLYGGGSVDSLNHIVWVPTGTLWLVSSALGSAIVALRNLVLRKRWLGFSSSRWKRSKAELKVALIDWIDRAFRRGCQWKLGFYHEVSAAEAASSPSYN